MGTRTIIRFGVGATLLAICAGVAAGDTRQEGPSPTTLSEVVKELRELRADLRTAVSSNQRLQALVTRILLQEQRVRSLSDRLNDVNERLEDLTAERREHELLAQQFDPDHVSESRVRQIRDREQRLQARAAELSTRLTDEQARWSEVNAQLEAFERALQRPR